MKKIFVFILASIICLFTAGAKNVNFQIIQDNPGQEDVFNTSYMFEQAMADFFFEAGHIVSNTPVYIRTDDSADKEEIKRALIETVLGSMDYLIRVRVVFIPEKANSAAAINLEGIKTVTWETYSSKTGKLLSSGSAAPEKIDETNNNETGVYNFASDVASKISSGLKNSK